MSIITPKQSRAARQLLDWTQEKLGKAANLAPSTIGNFEDEKKVKPLRPDTIEHISSALERAGIEFLEGQGVRLRCNNSVTYKGPNSCNDFFDEMTKEIRAKGGDVLVFIKNHIILTKYSGEPERFTNLERLSQFSGMAEIKCLIADPPRAPEFLTVPFETRIVSKSASPDSYFIYAGKLAFIYLDDCLDLSIMVLHEAALARSHKTTFDDFWNHAAPLKTKTSAIKRHIEASAFA